MSEEEEAPFAPSSIVRDTVIGGRYCVEREIGRGGMATVYLALDLKHDRQVALKIIHSEIADRLATERFRQEIALLAGLQHPNILALYDSGEFEGALFFVMPFIAGESLRALIERETRLEVPEALRIAREVADALAHAHAKEIIHRDIKPENILLSQGHALVGDFGIARAVTRAGARRFTDAGFAIGTFAYMSPEQASGDSIDGRSDQYSLGCVLYEMLTGQAPYEGAPITPARLRGGSKALPRVRDLRPAVPPHVDDAVMRSLEPAPSARFKSLSEFSVALADAHDAGHGLLSRFRESARARLAAALVGTAVLAVLFFAFRPAPLDPHLYVVLPFVHRAGAAPGLLNGDNCQQLLYQAFGRWDGITLVDDIRVHDERARAPAGTLTLDEALRSARSLHAGRLAWGEVWLDHGKLYIRALLYDVGAGRRLREYAVTARADLIDAEQRFNELADSLIVPSVGNGRATLGSSGDGMRGTSSIAALTAYMRAHEALAAWHLDSAEALFQSALESDPAYPHANYWLAQVMAWRGEDPASWLAPARRATLLSARLSNTDSAAAGALLALAEGNFPNACSRYARLATGADSLNFAVWYGLGDCRRLDTVVVQSAASPSGWRFRSGYASAIRAYVRALTLVPSAYRAFTGPAFARLELLLFTDVSLRRGARAGDSVIWVAYPSLSHDTLAFVPYRYADIASGRAPQPASTAAALTQNRNQLHGIVAEWVQEFPRSADAYETLARTLEQQGRINGVGGSQTSALGAVDHALSLDVSSEKRLDLRLMRTRLLLMSSQFAKARALADSLLDGADAFDSAQADQLKPLAALTGRVRLTVKLLEKSVPEAHFITSDGQLLQPPPAVASASRALLGYVSLGAPVDSILSTRRRLEQALSSGVPDREVARMRDAVENVSLRNAYTVLPSVSIVRTMGAGDYLLEIQRRAEQGDTAAVRRLLRSTGPAEPRASGQYPDVPLAYQEAWLHIKTGDSLAARQRLDSLLNELPALGPYLMDLVPNPAFLVRAMAHRSDLAASTGDVVTAKRWGAAVSSLWGSADSSLQPIVVRMRTRAH